ncbi:MAG: hypothetical protein BWK72_14575 [Rhodoferax ferrireducens]|uniref:Porin domain-containing protein n=1 Tax=Rhodoferax ferrireducens TaxID=192843 RepID=A0A1W9KS46_9BURK|nr:MAG: hypothetical protein BWK72_14575 [Rhodoferax ferrireducens]
MKKSLIALAVLAASGAAMAQSSVTLYGIADIWFGNVKTDGAGGTSVTQLTSGGVSTSEWGLKGSEDMGGGLKANFKLSQAYALDTGVATSGFNREAWVGLSGGFGEVKFGKVSSAYNDVEGAAGAAFGSGALGPIANAFVSDAEYTSRPANTMYYATPSFGGFNAMVSYSLDEKLAAVAANSLTVTPAVDAGVEIVSLGVAYSAGPFYAGLGYQTEDEVGSTVTAKYTQANVTYDLGVAKLLGAYGNVKNTAGLSGDDASEWQIGADVPLSSAFTVSTGYAKSKRSFTVGADDKVTVFSVAGAYSLSKRTTAYVGFATSKLDSTDVKTDRYAVGIKHTF